MTLVTMILKTIIDIIKSLQRKQYGAIQVCFRNAYHEHEMICVVILLVLCYWYITVLLP